MGWEPEEVHTHYDADGRETGHTIVTREPEWDDGQREVAMEALAYKRNVHHGCGNHISQSMDKAQLRYVDHATVICEDCRAIDSERERWHKAERHPDTGTCPCDDEIFYIEKREPLPI